MSLQDLHTVDLEDFKYGGTNITALRLVDPTNPALQELLQTWDGEDSDILGTGEVAGYTSLGSLQDIFEAAGRFPPQSSAILPAEYGRKSGGSNEQSKSGETTEQLQVNVTAISVRHRD